MKYRDVGVDIDKHWAVHREVARWLGGAQGLYTGWVEVGGVEAALHAGGVGTRAVLPGAGQTGDGGARLRHGKRQRRGV
jgi:phosphoribosylformylglycinamidine cyclo-ligase